MREFFARLFRGWPTWLVRQIAGWALLPEGSLRHWVGHQLHEHRMAELDRKLVASVAENGPEPFAFGAGGASREIVVPVTVQVDGRTIATVVGRKMYDQYRLGGGKH